MDHLWLISEAFLWNHEGASQNIPPQSSSCSFSPLSSLYEIHSCPYNTMPYCKKGIIIPRRWTNCNVNMKSSNCFLLQVPFTVSFCLLELFLQRPLHHCASTEKHHFSSFGLLGTVSVWTTAPTIRHKAEGVDPLCNVHLRASTFDFSLTNSDSHLFTASNSPASIYFSLLRVPAHTTSQHSVYCNKKWCQKS